MYSYTMSKQARWSEIKALVGHQEIWSQDELRRLLLRRGHDVTQATLSRDITELGLYKGPNGYALPNGAATLNGGPSIAMVLKNFVTGVQQAQNLLVVRTVSGSAQPVAVALDQEGWDEVVGTIGGDDTVLVICPDNAAAQRVKKRISEEIA